MRVIVLMNSLYTGGAEFSTLSFYQWFRQQGHQVELVCVKQASPAYDPLKFGFDQVHYLSGSFLKKVQSFNKLVRRYQPEIVHSVLFDANLVGRLSRMWKRNFIHLESLVNEMYSDYRLADPRVKKWKLEGYRWLDKITQPWGVDHFHANGEAVATHYKEKLSINPKRITVIHRGREPNQYVGDDQNHERIRKELRTGNRLLLIHVGRHEYQKGQDVLLDAIDLLGEWKKKIQVVLVGREGNYTELIKEKITSCHLESIVVMAGHRNDAAELLAAADIFVFPSRFEGLSGALIEAEAAGLPIVCSDIGNNREVVSEANALPFAVNNADEMAKQIAKLLNDKSLREQMGKASRAIFNQRFYLEKSHLRMEQLLVHLVGGRWGEEDPIVHAYPWP